MAEMEFSRHRRLRQNAAMRSLVRETFVRSEDLIYPIFIAAGENVRNEIHSMPGIYQLSLDHLLGEVKEAVELGIQSFILFGVPYEHDKDACGSGAFSHDGLIQQGIRLVKEQYPEVLVIADTCLCEYTDHGHCGIVKDGEILNDESLEYLVKTAVSQAEAGADIIAPSNMMDGFVTAIRAGLNEAGYQHIPIMSYAVKYASAFYGPFRDAANGAPQFGDRKTYQMDPANRLEAMREAQSDVQEGADFLIVKPAMAYMDIIRDVKNEFNLPIVAYNVSGEYSMIKAAAINGWINEKEIVMESMVGLKRAGADIIITYFAKDIARWLKEQ
ncbi:porphobilinogen synthase [Bacillus testis]|uniref:porphobilinogen synthase n=1 Tax=Bacillus testis TaxID=1622072 RepID=UPI00067EF102|nr:porphobilinogen synthase [Bacillus testis]